MASGDAVGNHRELLTFQEIPQVMRCRFIMRGYRKLHQPWSFYLRSLMTLHNETLNVWTHLLGTLLVIIETTLLRREFDDKYPMECDFAKFFATCSTMMHLASTSTHLLHSRSCRVHMFVFFCDYVGISIASLAVSLSIFCFSSLPSYAAFLRPIFLPLAAVNAFAISSVFCYTFATRRRQYSLVVRIQMLLPIMTFYIWTFTNFFHKIVLKFGHGETEMNIQFHHMGHLIILLLSFVFYITRFPERFYPGQFDICGQSHQLFHCGVTISQWLVIKAIRSDLSNDSPLLYSRQSQPIPLRDIWTTWIILVAVNLAAIGIIHKRFCSDIEPVKDSRASQ